MQYGLPLLSKLDGTLHLLNQYNTSQQQAFIPLQSESDLFAEKCSDLLVDIVSCGLDVTRR